MSQRCPVCRARLWSDFWSLRLKCPRCGTEFRPTVSWGYFRVVILVVTLLMLLVGFSFASHQVWISLLLGAVIILILWSVPRFVDLQQVLPTDLTLADGPQRDDALQLRLYRALEDEGEAPERRGPGDLTLLAGLLLLTFLLMVWYHFLI